MKISNYEIGKEIGSGAFGTVNIGEDRTTGEKVAVKCISKCRIQRSNMGSQVKKEITTMKKLDHPNIVRIKEVLMSNSHLYLVLEYAGGGELFTKIASQGKLSENVAKRYFKQVMEAVKFCHLQYICHRDIKPENILLDSNDNVKIADFGFASIMEPEKGSDFDLTDNDSPGKLASIDENACTAEPLDDFIPDRNQSPPKMNKFRNLPSKIMQKMSTMCGTTQYMAPEIVSRDSYRGDKADIWSCGVVLFVLVSGYLPFDSNDTGVVIQKIQHGRFETPSFISDLTRDIIQKLLTPNPLTRPGARTVLDHQWFQDTVPIRLAPVTTTGILPQIKSKLPTVKLVGKEERKFILSCSISEATTKAMGILRENAWMQKPDDGYSIKASKMTSTGLAMIQVIMHRESDTTTGVEVEVFGKQKNSGARDINKYISEMKELWKIS